MLDSLKTLTPRAEFYMCLSQAFRPPIGADTLMNFKEALVEDLYALNEEIAFKDPHQISTLLDLLNDYDDQEDFLIEYSKLFLTPPAPAPLNLGFYLDGTLCGPSTTEMEVLYQKYAMQRDESFKDLPDHLSLLLFFYAWGMALAIEWTGQKQPQPHILNLLTDLRGAMDRYGVPAFNQLIRKMDEAVETRQLNAFYVELARLTKSAIVRDLAFLDTILPAEESKPAKPQMIELGDELRVSMTPQGKEVACNTCDRAFSHSDQMALMIHNLQESGLTTDHLLVCPECRARSMGMWTLELPH